MTELIQGINPLCISTIYYNKMRRYGPHPVWTKYMKKKNPICGLFGLYNPSFLDGIYRPHVIIRGADGDILKKIKCRSNDHAKSLCHELTAQLDDFLTKVKCND